MANPAILYGAGQALSQLGGYLGANSAAKKRQKMIDAEIKRLTGQLGTDYIDVNGTYNASNRAIINSSAKSGRSIDRSLGLDTGQAQGGIAERLAGQQAGLLGDLRLTNETGKASRDAQLNDRISQLKTTDSGSPSTASLLTGLAGTALNTYGNVSAEKQAKQATQDAVNQAPKPYNPLVNGAFDTGYERGIPLQQGNNNQYEQAIQGFAQQPQELSDYEKAQEARRILDDFGLVSKGFSPYEPKQGKPPTDYVSKIGSQYNSDLADYEKNQSKFLQETQFSENPPQSPYKKPDISQIVSLYNSQMARELGANAPDSVMSQLQQALGISGGNNMSSFSGGVGQQAIMSQLQQDLGGVNNKLSQLEEDYKNGLIDKTKYLAWKKYYESGGQ